MAKKETKKKMKQQAKAGAGVPPVSGAAAAGQAPDAAAAAANINNAAVDRSQMTADQLTQVQLEEAIKESQDPSTKLKKLKSPLSFKSCLLNLVILVVLTVAIVLLCCYIMLDHETFNLWVVIKDMFNKFGITDFFKKIGSWFKRVFS